MIITRRHTVLVPYVRVLEAAPAYPVTLAEAKRWCRVDEDDTSQDEVLNLLIAAATERAEEITGRAFVLRRLELRLDAFPESGAPIEIPFPPLISVDYIKYLDTSGELQTMDGSPSEYVEDTGSEPGRVQPVDGTDWPATDDLLAAVMIGFTCGYAPGEGSPTDYGVNVPALAKQWMNARIASFYENRESLMAGGQFQQPPRDFVDGLLDGLRVLKLFA